MRENITFNNLYKYVCTYGIAGTVYAAGFEWLTIIQCTPLKVKSHKQKQRQNDTYTYSVKWRR